MFQGSTSTVDAASQFLESIRDLEYNLHVNYYRYEITKCSVHIGHRDSTSYGCVLNQYGLFIDIIVYFYPLLIAPCKRIWTTASTVSFFS